MPPSLHLNLSVPVPNDPRGVDDDQLGLANDATNASSVPTLWGIPLKYLSLITLALQNSMLALIMHYSRVSTPPSRAYSAATAVLMNEILKGTISLVIAFSNIPAPADTAGQLLPSFVARAKRLAAELFSPDCWKLSIPAILYVIQNNLQFVAASNLAAVTFQVSSQMKILTTAAFSVILLRKKLISLQWTALLFLAIGVGVVQIQLGVRVVREGVPLEDIHTMNALKGFIAVATASLTSGLAGVYFEMVLKGSQTDLWVRNVQLSLFSLLPALAPVFYLYASDPQDGWLSALFRNFGGWAWGTVFVQVFGGLLTALVIKYADNILKGFATSLSIVISFLVSVALFDFQITFTFVLGSTIVLVATWLYNHQPKRSESFLWAFNWSEKWRSVSPLRSPAVPYNPLTVAASTTTSRSSSAVSLNSLAAKSDDSKDSLLFSR
ncbi:nucleotide-sugar transporter-domain-containing protein [Roridomyces roridus]|uniref:Nucleotide-sugar transporter-domain-containing protein n=1 Tax=Roridomyces roridus TaxID=1738132 RepID=A0AAD7FMF9_9AGAR|nr:nucleotide-sugar transporter-domain-containing protein [Roridomyces roridus]